MTERAEFLLSQIAEEVRGLPILTKPETSPRGASSGGRGRGPGGLAAGGADEASGTPQVTGGWGAGHVARIN